MTENVGMCPVCYDRNDAELRTVPGVIYSKESNCPNCSRAVLMAEVERLEKALISAAETININHARAEAAEVERDRLRGVVTSLREIIDRNVVDSGQEQHRLFLDGEVYTGPPVDFLHRLMTAIRGLCDKALNTTKGSDQ